MPPEHEVAGSNPAGRTTWFPAVSPTPVEAPLRQSGHPEPFSRRRLPSRTRLPRPLPGSVVMPARILGSPLRSDPRLLAATPAGVGLSRSVVMPALVLGSALRFDPRLLAATPAGVGLSAPRERRKREALGRNSIASITLRERSISERRQPATDNRQPALGNRHRSRARLAAASSTRTDHDHQRESPGLRRVTLSLDRYDSLDVVPAAARGIER
jgi:hypothetical protein